MEVVVRSSLLAMLLMRDEVKASRPAWYPASANAKTIGLSPGQVQRSAFGYLMQLGTPARDTKKCWKRKRLLQKLPSSRQNPLSAGKKGKQTAQQCYIHRLKTGLVTFSVFKVRALFRHYVRISKVKLKSSLLLRFISHQT